MITPHTLHTDDDGAVGMLALSFDGVEAFVREHFPAYCWQTIGTGDYMHPLVHMAMPELGVPCAALYTTERIDWDAGPDWLTLSCILAIPAFDGWMVCEIGPIDGGPETGLISTHPLPTDEMPMWFAPELPEDDAA